MEFLIIILILVAYGITYYFKKRIVPKIKGSIGEYKVATKLKRLDKKEYLILNDLLLKNGNFTTQIDHVVICRGGIIVIETKNYKGWIHGHENSEYWTQSIYKHKSKLRNPIKQNWIHVFAIKKILSEYNYIKYFPIVVFAGDGKLKNVTTSLPVIYTNKLIRTIKNLNEQENLSYNQMELISDKLLKNNITDQKASKNHSYQIKKQIREQNKKVKQKICPKCGNKLIKKSGKYGKFYGCDNFPKCRYTLNI
ncbi:NERD domain-containing protein [Mariniflexile maritimum]|uniref:NERD domain-containing protein n=1 Tax=Mariniflexile maritimum TaxID=2682493 RepID=UPI0012F6FA15|nr:NERD domain-containing protein [Mariniflexile maritimum]